MSISELASIGEFASGIAVLISLVYLGVQVRQATIQFRRSEENAAQAHTAVFRTLGITHRDVAEMFMKGLRDPASLDEVDQFRFSLMLHEFTWLAHQTWERRRLKISDRPMPVTRVKNVLSSPGGSRWWAENREAFSPQFQTMIDGLLRSGAG